MPVRVRLPNPLTVLDDRALLARFTEQHDQPAFEQLVKRHGGLVFGVCRRAVRDVHLAEDAFQAVFLVLARNPAGAAKAASVGGWLFGVARRVGLAARRHEQRRARRAGGISPLMIEDHEASASRSPSDFDEVLHVLEEELSAMPDELRAPLVACFLEERTQDEASRELGWSLSTLRRRLERGKELLRSRLARRGVTLALGLLSGAVAAPARAAVPPLANCSAPSPVSAALAAEAVRRGIGAKFVGTLAAVAVAGGLALGLANASPDEDRPPPVPPARAAVLQPEPGPDLAPAPRAAVPKQWVSVSGRVVFPKEREIPKLKLVPPNAIKDAELWKAFGPPAYEDRLIHPNNRGIANVVVWLRPDSADRKAAFPEAKIHPDLMNAKPVERFVQIERGQFAPRIVAARAGDHITFGNPLPVPTNVQYMESSPPDGGEARDFNILIGADMLHTAKPLPVLRTPDMFRSNIYQWMSGYVWAFDHPYFAVTDADGRFEISNAPAGTWRLVVWHEAVGYLGGAAGRWGEKFTVPENLTGKLELEPLTFESKSWSE